MTDALVYALLTLLIIDIFLVRRQISKLSDLVRDIEAIALVTEKKVTDLMKEKK